MTGDEHPFAPIATNHETILHGFWAEIEGNGADVAKDVCENYFDEETWADYFGEDQIEGGVLLTITSPAPCVGTYQVSMERVVRARAVLKEGVII